MESCYDLLSVLVWGHRPTRQWTMAYFGQVSLEQLDIIPCNNALLCNFGLKY